MLRDVGGGIGGGGGGYLSNTSTKQYLSRSSGVGGGVVSTKGFQGVSTTEAEDSGEGSGHHKQPAMEEDELARIREIFKAFDTAGKDRVLTEKLPQVLRLLTYNITEGEIPELQAVMNEKRGKNYFLFEDLVELMQEYSFYEDTEAVLYQALLELDQDGDGLIPKDEMASYLTTMGETFSD